MDYLNLYKDILGLLPEGSLQELMEIAYQYVKMPILATDVTYSLLGMYPRELTGDASWDDLLRYGKYDTEMILQLYEDGIMQSADRHELPYLVDWGRAARENPKVVGLIRIDGHTEGFVSLMCGKGNCTDELLGALEIIQKACSLLYQADKSRSSIQTMQQKAFAGELLSGKIETRGQLEQWYDNTGFRPPGNYMVLAVGSGPENSKTEETVLSNLYGEAEKMFPEQLSLIHHQVLYVLRFHVGDGEREEQRIGRFRKLLKKFRCSCGASIPFTDLLHTPDYIRQAKDALELGRHRAEKGKIFYYRDCALLAVLHPGAVNMPERNFLHPAVRILRAYDAKHHTEFLRTLQSWVTHLGRQAEVLEELHVHRNTLPYRLDKIEKLTGYSLADFETVLHLAVNFYMMEQEKTENSPE